MTPESEELHDLVKNFRVPIDPEKREDRSFSTFREAKEFFEREVEFWRPHSSRGVLSNIHGEFQNVLNALQQAEKQPEGRQARDQVNHAATRLQQRRLNVVCSDTPFAHFLVALATKDPELARAAMTYRDGTFRQNQLTSSRENLEGILATVAFQHPDFFSSGLDARVEAFDRKSAEASTVVDNLLTKFETLQGAMNDWKEATQADLSKTSGSATTTFSKTNTEWTETFRQAHEAAQAELVAIRKAYDEQMRLEEPAQYWNDLEQDYTKKGRFWAFVSAIAVVIFAAAVTVLAYQPPDIFTTTTNKLAGIKGALLIAAGMSLFIYLINLFVKMTTSSFHLARDAKERFQLTHVFLALIKDQAMEPKDRAIVLSALFSRADTGLLKGDSSPTMPSAIGTVAEVFRGNR